MKEIFFRVDTNDIVATGHIMRCLSIADAAAQTGYRPVFIMADENGKSRVEDRGYEAVILGSKWDAMEGEVDLLGDVIKKRGIKRLIVDSYYATDEYFRAISAFTKVIYVDDLGLFKFPVAGVICYANYYDKFKYVERFEKSGTSFYLGCRYVPLRKEFSNLPDKDIKDRIKTVLLMSGGGDQYHVLKQFIAALRKRYDFELEVICGQYNTDYDELVKTYEKDEPVHIHKSVDDMIRYMQKADVAVSAGGTTLYELSACGTPALTYSFTDNQLDNVRKFQEDGLMKYLGDLRTDDVVGNLMAAMDEYMDKDLRHKLSKGLKQLVDGQGAGRLVEKMMREDKE